jgi:hypothetical protein
MIKSRNIRSRLNNIIAPKTRRGTTDIKGQHLYRKHHLSLSYKHTIKQVTLIHPESIRLLTNSTWDFARNTLWKRFPFYEDEIEMRKNHIRKYYENIPPELFTETANMYFISYCIKILLTKNI